MNTQPPEAPARNGPETPQTGRRRCARGAVSFPRPAPQRPGRRRAGKAGKDRRLHVGGLAWASWRQTCATQGVRRAGKAGKDRRLHVGGLAWASWRQTCATQGVRRAGKAGTDRRLHVGGLAWASWRQTCATQGVRRAGKAGTDRRFHVGGLAWAPWRQPCPTREARRTLPAGGTLKRRVRHFLMVEAVAAMGVLGLLVVGVYAGIQTNERMLQHFVSQRQALDVLENVVERAAAEAPVSAARCRELFADELAQSPLAGQPSVQTACEALPAGGVCYTIRSRNRLLAEIRMGSP